MDDERHETYRRAWKSIIGIERTVDSRDWRLASRISRGISIRKLATRCTTYFITATLQEWTDLGSRSGVVWTARWAKTGAASADGTCGEAVRGRSPCGC